MPSAQRLQSAWVWPVGAGFYPGAYVKRSEEGEVLEAKGVIACSRCLSDDAVALTLGCAGEYVDLTLPRAGYTSVARLVHVRPGGDGWSATYSAAASA